MPRPATIPAPRTAPSANDLSLTLADVAARLGVTYWTARRLALTGAIQFARIGQQFRFRPSWVENYITRRR